MHPEDMTQGMDYEIPAPRLASVTVHIHVAPQPLMSQEDCQALVRRLIPALNEAIQRGQIHLR